MISKYCKPHLSALAIIFLSFIFITPSFGQSANYMQVEAKDSAKIFHGRDFYPVTSYFYTGREKTPKNVILLIGDGMGLAQTYAGLTANGGDLYIKNFKNIGFATTYAANKYVTGSAASGTALATGQKTNYTFIGVDPNGEKLKNIREIAQENGKATGVVSTSSVTHATPASFVGHQPTRYMEEEIAGDFVNSGIDVFIGGGLKFFTERKDGENLLDDLKSKGYQISTDIDEIAGIEEGKLAGLVSPNGTPRRSERGDMLCVATTTALNILDNDPDGFFLMIEGSQIDWAGHANDTPWIVEEVHDFDQTIGIVLEFAAKNQETLVIVTADHETGGLTIEDGNLQTGMVKGDFTTGSHTGIMVPVYAFGPGAENFTGFMDNTDIPNRIKKFLYPSSDKSNKKAKRKNRRSKN